MTKEELLRIAVVGSQSFVDYPRMKDLLDGFINIQGPRNIELISSGSEGVGALVKQYAEESEIPIKMFPPNWDKYGKVAGFVRNPDIVNEADKIIAFWDGRSLGTEHLIKEAQKMGNLPYIVNCGPKDGGG